MPRRELSWEQKYYRMDKMRRFAWAKFYELANQEHERDYDHYRVIVNIVEQQTELDSFVKKQLIEMGAELKKTWECPICLEFIEKENLDITPCGHYYCKGCLKTLREQEDAKCAVCRRKFGAVKSDDE